MSKFIKIIYFLLFVGLVIHPHLVPDHIGILPEAYAESLVTIFIVGAGVAIYYLHQQEVKKSKKLQEDLRISQGKLLDSFKYIGSVNTRLPLFKRLSSELLASSKYTKQHKKTIFNNLLASAIVSIAKAKWGLLRFVEIDTQRTVKEFLYTNGDYVLLTQRVGNRELLSTRNQSSNIKDLGEFQVVPTSDEEITVQGFLILPKAESNLDNEYPFLQVVVDQSQLFYKYLFA